MKEPLTGNIDFLLTIDTTNGQRTFNATLKNIEGEFRIYLHSDSAITWDNEISFFTFGENLKTENAQINGTEIELDLSKAKLITMQTQTIISSKVNIYILFYHRHLSIPLHRHERSKQSFILSKSPKQHIGKQISFNRIWAKKGRQQIHSF